MSEPRPPKLECPNCGHSSHQAVIDSRPVFDMNAIQRRRMCEVCGKAFITQEVTMTRSQLKALQGVAEKLERAREI